MIDPRQHQYERARASNIANQCFSEGQSGQICRLRREAKFKMCGICIALRNAGHNSRCSYPGGQISHRSDRRIGRQPVGPAWDSRDGSASVDLCAVALEWHPNKGWWTSKRAPAQRETSPKTPLPFPDHMPGQAEWLLRSHFVHVWGKPFATDAVTPSLCNSPCSAAPRLLGTCFDKSSR